jgi:hypothetical protein
MTQKARPAWELEHGARAANTIAWKRSGFGSTRRLSRA